MIRLGKNVISSVLATFTALSLAACGGGGHPSSALPPSAQGPGSTAPQGLVSATFTIKIPGPTTTSSHARRASYISAATKSVRVNMTSDSAGVAITSQFNVLTQVTNSSGTSPGAPCTGSGPWTCTVTLYVPPGSDAFTFTTYDDTTGTGTGASHILSQQIQTLTVVKAVANSFTITFDANANTMTIGTTSGFCAGSFNVTPGGSVATVGTAALTFNASYTDGAGQTFVNPVGKPILSVNGHTDDNGGAGYTITGTGGNVTVKVTQSTQSYTLAATNTSTSATINVAATPANTTGSSDGLAFNKTLSYTFQSGPAPPASFLANAQQIINGSGVVTGGQINLYTITLGASDTFNTVSPATLATSNGDIDFPNDLLFDGNGDLMIANGGAGNPDFGNFACVPAGSITTGANNATVLTNNMNDPKELALGADSSVALINAGNAPTDLMAEFVLSGTYTAASATRDIAKSSYPTDGALGVVAIPASGANPAGSYIVSLSNNTQASTHLLIKHPDGSTAEFPQDPSDVFPYITYDPANNQLVAANSNGTSSHITFWSVASMTKVKDMVIENDGLGNSQAAALGPIASSADGHIAVAVTGASGFPELIIYDNTASRNKVQNTIDYGATTTSCGATFTYGGTVSANVANKLVWLSNTKLLVNLYSQHSHVATGANGMYIYDITQTMAQSGFDGNCNAEPTPTVKQTGFQSLSNAPFAAAYKP